jgi:signal peptidase I
MKNTLYKAYRFSNSWTGTIIIVLFVIFFVAQAFRIPSGSMKDSLLIGDHLFAKKFAYGISMPHIPFLEISIMPWSDKLRLIDGDTPKRGDIVIFRPPHQPKNHFVKRCFALPNDEVLFTDANEIYLRPHEGDEYIKANYPKENIVKLLDKLWVKNPMAHLHPGIHNDKNHNIYEDYLQSYLYRKDSVSMMPMSIEALPTNYKLPFNAFYKKIEENRYFMVGDNRDHSGDSRFWGSVPYDNIEGTPWFIYFSVDENWEIRWDRIGKTPTDLEMPEHLDKARAERITKDKDDHGIY